MCITCLQVPVEAKNAFLLALLELELEAFVNYLMWVLGTMPGFLAARAACVLNHLDIYPAPQT